MPILLSNIMQSPTGEQNVLNPLFADPIINPMDEQNVLNPFFTVPVVATRETKFGLPADDSSLELSSEGNDFRWGKTLGNGGGELLFDANNDDGTLILETSSYDFISDPLSPLYPASPTNEIVGGFTEDILYGNSEYTWDPEFGLVMTFADDMIYGLEGDDQLFGQGGDDFLSGGEGNDEMYGGTGDDIIAGGVGLGDDGIDQMFGGPGADTFLLGKDGLAHYVRPTTDSIEFPDIGEVHGFYEYTIIKDFTSEDSIAAPDVNYGTYHVDNASYSGSGNANVQDTLIYFESNDPALPLNLVGVVVDYSGPLTVVV